MKKLLMTAALVLIPAMAIAADSVTPTWERESNGKPYLKWTGLQINEWPQDAAWPHGCGHVTVTGDIDDGEIEMTIGYSSGGTVTYTGEDVQAPEGLQFDSTSGRWGFFEDLPADAWLGIVQRSAGTLMNVDVVVKPCSRKLD